MDPIDRSYHALAAAILLRAARDAADERDGYAREARKFLLASTWAAFLAGSLGLERRHLERLARGVDVAALRAARRAVRMAEVLEFFTAHPGAEVKALAELMGVHEQSVRGDLYRLAAAGLLERIRRGVWVRCD